MAESRAPQGNEWADGVEALHGLTNMVTVRSLYQEGHPAIARADGLAAAQFIRLLERLPELVVALLDGEFVVCERPMPELRSRIGVLAQAMERHEIECIVLQHGVTAEECKLLGRTLADPVDTTDPARVREQAQANLVHVLLRYAELRAANEIHRRGDEAPRFVPDVERVLHDAARALSAERQIDRVKVTSLAHSIVRAVSAGAFALDQRCWARDVDDLAAHSSNVALMTAAMALEGGWHESTCIDLTAAALLHDIGQLFLPPQLRNVPDPFLDDATRPVFRNHCFAGASALLAAGCPSLWVAVALEHHRGIDGKGYPTLESRAAPHDLVRIVALASFYDRKCTAIGERVDEPDRALRRAAALENRFFHARELELFVRALGVFPPGTTVELSDRRPAVVTRAKSGDPVRPNVRILHGADEGKRAELKTLDAVEDRHALSIVRAIAPPIVLFDPNSARARADAVQPAEDDVVDLGDLVVAEEKPPTPVPPPPIADVPLSLSRLPQPLVSSSRLPAVRNEHAPTPDIVVKTEHDGRIEPDWSHAASSLPPAISRAPVVPPPPAAPQPAGSTVDEEQSLRARLVSMKKVPKLRVAPSALTKLPLDHRAGFVLSLVDGASSLEEIIDVSGLPPVEVLRVVVALIGQGVIALE